MPSFCEGKVAVVTGAGGTLCSCIAKDLALKGAKVVLIGRTREKLEKVAGEIEGEARVEPGDVTDEQAMQEIADRVLAEWGPCRFLINGAGGNNVKAMPTRLRFSEADLTPTTDFDKDRGFWDIDLAAFKSVLEINTLGTVIPSKVFGRQMATAGGGSILNFGSTRRRSRTGRCSSRSTWRLRTCA